MKNIKKFSEYSLFLVMCLALSHQAFANGGTVVGNGGDAIVCDREVSFFDIYENSKIGKLNFDLGPSDLDPYLKVQNVLDSFPPINAAFKATLQHYFAEFKQKNVIARMELVDVPDTANVVMKPDCQLKQAVVQFAPQSPGDPVYFVDQRIWERFDNDSKAALILHEILYRHAITKGHKDSRQIRQLNGYLMSKPSFVEEPCALQSELDRYNLNVVGSTGALNGIQYLLENSSIMSNCAVIEGFHVAGKLEVAGQLIAPANAIKSTTGAFIPAVEENEDGTLKKILTEMPLSLNSSAGVLNLAQSRDTNWDKTTWWRLERQKSIFERPAVLSFYRDGSLKSASVKDSAIMVLNQVINFTGDVYFEQESHELDKIEGGAYFSIKAGGVVFQQVRLIELNGQLPKLIWNTKKSILPLAVGSLKISGVSQFTSTGFLKFTNLSEPSVIKVQGKAVKLSASSIELYNKLSLKQALVAQDVSLVTVSGKMKTIKAGEALLLNEDGSVID